MERWKICHKLEVTHLSGDRMHGVVGGLGKKGGLFLAFNASPTFGLLSSPMRFLLVPDATLTGALL